MPAAVEWPITVVGERSVPVPLTVTGGEWGARVSDVEVQGADASDFHLTSDGCETVLLSLNQRCRIEVLAEPSAAGTRTAQLLVLDSSGATTSVPLSVFAERSPGEISHLAHYEFSRLKPAAGKRAKVGRAVAVSFHLASGAHPFATAAARLQIAPETGPEAGIFRPASSTTDRFDQFAYANHGNYRYRLATGGLSGGPWSLRVKLDDGTTHATSISLRQRQR
jgi:hypothetical protein